MAKKAKVGFVFFQASLAVNLQTGECVRRHAVVFILLRFQAE